MGDAAQGEPIKHIVFEKPFKVEPQFELWNTPENYRRYPGGDKLPDKIKVWRVQNTDKTFGGVVSRSYGYNDSPDAEILTPGYNGGKECGAVGVGRHGNFLQWGFSAPPSQMTDAGKSFFLNCVSYIHKFDGKAPLVRTVSPDRMDSIRIAALISQISDKSFFSHTFPQDLLRQYDGNPAGLVRYYKDDYELIYWENVFRIDSDLKSLGIDSNRKISTLERLIGLLKDEGKAGAAKSLLTRYTEQSFKTAPEWQAWLDKNRERIYFSDVGGYKFRVVPEGYPVAADR
jgi:hypothetical protein